MSTMASRLITYNGLHTRRPKLLRGLPCMLLLAAGLLFSFTNNLIDMSVPYFARKAEPENDTKWLNQFTPLQILDSIPENKSFTKDSGRWLIHDDNDDIVLEQSGNETFPDFIKRYALSILQGDNDIEREAICTNLATINLWEAIKNSV